MENPNIEYLYYLSTNILMKKKEPVLTKVLISPSPYFKINIWLTFCEIKNQTWKQINHQVIEASPKDTTKIQKAITEWFETFCAGIFEIQFITEAQALPYLL